MPTVTSRRRSGWERELHRLSIEGESEVPTRHEATPIPFEDFVAFILGRRPAADTGHRSIRTSATPSNAAMLAVDDLPGFERGHSRIEYLGDL